MKATGNIPLELYIGRNPILLLNILVRDEVSYVPRAEALRTTLVSPLSDAKFLFTWHRYVNALTIPKRANVTTANRVTSFGQTENTL